MLFRSVTYTLAGQQVKTLLGLNKVWVYGTGKDITNFTYYVDYSAYEADVQKTYLENIATVEETSTASQNYAVGDYLIYDNQLYKVTSAISSGGTITVGTNVTAVNVTDTKVDKDVTAASGNLPTYNASGNLSDSGTALASLMPKDTDGVKDDITIMDGNGDAVDSGKSIGSAFPVRTQTVNDGCVLAPDSEGLVPIVKAEIPIASATALTYIDVVSCDAEQSIFPWSATPIISGSNTSNISASVVNDEDLWVYVTSSANRTYGSAYFPINLEDGKTYVLMAYIEPQNNGTNAVPRVSFRKYSGGTIVNDATGQGWVAVKYTKTAADGTVYPCFFATFSTAGYGQAYYSHVKLFEVGQGCQLITIPLNNLQNGSIVMDSTHAVITDTDNSTETSYSFDDTLKLYDNAMFANNRHYPLTLTYHADPNGFADENISAYDTLVNDEVVIHKTVSGDVVTVYDGAEGFDVKDMTVEIYPHYDMTATPTSESPLDIVPYSRMPVNVTGKNLIGGINLADQIKRYMAGSNLYLSTGDVAFTNSQTTTAGVGYFLGIKTKPNTRYTVMLKAAKSSVSNVRANLAVYYSDGNTEQISLPSDAVANTKYMALKTTSATKTFMGVTRSSQGGSTYIYYDECGVFEGVLTEAEYEPYVGTQHNAEFPIDVYRATYKPLTGSLSVRPVYESYNGEEIVGPYLSSIDGYQESGTPTIGALVVDYGGTPTEYTIEPMKFKTHGGVNNFWAGYYNAVGSRNKKECDISVTYRANTNLYINEVVKENQSMIAPVEDGDTASKAYAQGSYLIRNGVFYKVTSAIASGGTFTVGTNISATTVATELMALA